MQRGFSLVELSIVLVILGLLTGGILAGQSLIRAAELRTVPTEYAKYMTAAQTFRDKYFALPGDFTKAQDVWGVAHATPATCKTTRGVGTETCNGDGNGRIQISAVGSNEIFRFWQHLANAGLIEGTYDGVATDNVAASFQSSAANIPRGRLSSSYWAIYDYGQQAGLTYMFDGDYTNSFVFGVLGTAWPDYLTFKPEEAWNIDTKMDDGKPAQGKFVVRVGGVFNQCTNASSSTATNANYLLTNSALVCGGIFPRLF